MFRRTRALKKKAWCTNKAIICLLSLALEVHDAEDFPGVLYSCNAAAPCIFVLNYCRFKQITESEICASGCANAWTEVTCLLHCPQQSTDWLQNLQYMIWFEHFEGPSSLFVVVENSSEPTNLKFKLLLLSHTYPSVSIQSEYKPVLFIEGRHTRDFKGRTAREAHPSEIKGMFLFFLSSLEHTPLHNSNNLVHLHITPQIRVLNRCF